VCRGWCASRFGDTRRESGTRGNASLRNENSLNACVVSRPILRLCTTVWSPPILVKRPLAKFFATRGLSRTEECLHEFAFPANDHAGEALEPFPCGNLGCGIEPLDEVAELLEKFLANEYDREGDQEEPAADSAGGS
jgi:hypothetical protein